MKREEIAQWAQRLLPAGVSRTGRRLQPGLRYLLIPEVHVYASSIAANALLSLFPFTLILLRVCRRWLHWEAAYQVILQLLRANLPAGGAFVIRNLTVMVGGRSRLDVISVLTLCFTSSGIFLPLEIALNKVWGFTRNRSFLHNVAVSFVLAVVSGVLALLSILLAAKSQALVRGLERLPVPFVAAVASRIILETISVLTVTVIYFLIFYFLPHGKVPARYVLPGALVAGILTELGKFAYLVSLPLFGFREVYGPFTLPATLFFWAFVGALILLWGAHLSHRGFERSSERRLRDQARQSQSAMVETFAKVHEHQAGNPEHS